MMKNTKRINACLSLIIASSLLGGCGTKEDKWNYSREDFPLFIKYKGLLKHLEGKKYSYSISLGKGRVKESVKADDLILFNTTDATKKMNELKKEYLDYETLSSSSIKIENFKVENNSNINFTFEADSKVNSYSVLLNKNATTFGNFVAVDNFMTKELFSDSSEDVIKERNYINSEYEESEEVNFFFEIISNLGTSIIGGLTDNPVSVWSGIIGILQTLATSFGSSASIADVLHLLIETEQKIDDLSNKIDRNTEQLADEIIRTQAEIDKDLLEELNSQITGFVSDTVSKINDFNRSFADEVGDAYKNYISSGSLDVKLHIEKNEKGEYSCTPLAQLDESDINLVIHITDFANSSKFLKDHGNIVEKGFTDEFNKDLDAAIAKESGVPSDLDKEILSKFVQGMISEMIAKAYYSNPDNKSKAQNLRDIVINYCDRLSGADGGKAILQSYVERLGLMFNFGSEIKESVTHICANLLFRLQTNVARASQALLYAELSSEELREHFLIAQDKIKEVHQNVMDLSDEYSFAIKTNLTSYFIKTGFNAYFTNKGNEPSYHADLYIKNLIGNGEGGEVKEENSSYDKHHILNYIDHLKVATRLNLMKSFVEDLKDTVYIDYLQSRNIISHETYSAYQYVAHSEESFEDGYRFLGGDLVTATLSLSDSGYGLYCNDNGNPGGATYFRTGYWFNYGTQRDGSCWSGTTYTSTIIDANSGQAIGNQKIFGYAKYFEDHWYWRNVEAWAFMSYPDGYFAFTLESAA